MRLTVVMTHPEREVGRTAGNRPRPLERGDEIGEFIVVDQDAVIWAEERLGLVSEYRGARRACVGDCALRVDDENQVRRTLHECPEPAFAALG